MTADRAQIVALSAGELADAVRTGTIAAVEAARAYLAQVEDTAARLGAYVRTTPALALAEAAAVDAARARGEPLGPLAGVPYGLKDSLVTAGVATAAGSRMLAGWVPPYDGAHVRRMRAAGAVLLGKLALDEFGMGAHGDLCADVPEDRFLDGAGGERASEHARMDMSGRTFAPVRARSGAEGGADAAARAAARGGGWPSGHPREGSGRGEGPRGAWSSGHVPSDSPSGAAGRRWSGPSNPWSSGHVPGGSSSGAAAAVAGRAAAVAVGSDTGGSIRVPAARCGLVGVRPTWGRVSRAGLVAFASSLDTVGPLARTVDDAARVLTCLAGQDDADSTSLRAPVPDYAAMAARGRGDGLRGVTIGVDPAGLAGVEPAVAEAFAAALATLVGVGAAIVEVALPDPGQALAAYAALSAVEAVSNLARYDGVRYGLCVPKDSFAATAAATRGAGFGREVKRRLVLGAWLQAEPELLARARAARATATAGLQAALAGCDALASPTCAEAGVRVREAVLEDSLRAGRALVDLDVDRFTVAASLAGLPALSLPCGLTAGPPALPIGLHLVGRRLEEGRLLAIAAAFEAATPWRARLFAGPEGA
ncbi:Amidase [Nannocystis exedens]|uniref:Amidase n=1 Tax=Nannocystis exedens TaxID=54 RepID=A0A1I1VTL9_9BACT|nr:amidase [Nannocystis exedens]PCC72822.1 aspartyl/glutamyl-tRNA amidotransferase subunit A [Nannocystis exedens]SFD86164.1 Amidase [Nannocystis exedens]